MRRFHLPILEPCAEDWSAMTGDERRRHCSSCDREVLHLSAMTADEARQALAARPGERVCVRYGCDADDNIIFAPRLRAAALVTALAACTAGEAVDPAPVSEAVEEEPQSCDEEPVVAPPAQREEELPAVIHVPGAVVDIEVAAPERVSVSVTKVKLESITMGVPLVRMDAPPLAARPQEPAEPRHVVPLETWQGALPPDLVAGAVPRDEE
jgi:hypothetical protein